jgi:multidrug transporter EmrE-like cation transporter
MSYLLLFASVSLTAVAQICLKLAATSINWQRGLPFLDNTLQALSVGYLWAGAMSFFVSFVIWIVVLTRVEVSFAYPFISLGILLVTVFGYLFLGESLPGIKLLGIGLILVGVSVLALSHKGLA